MKKGRRIAFYILVAMVIIVGVRVGFPQPTRAEWILMAFLSVAVIITAFIGYMIRRSHVRQKKIESAKNGDVNEDNVIPFDINRFKRN